MKIIRVNDAKEGGQVAFCLLKDYLKKGARTLGLATGSTPETFYQEICQSDLDFSDVITINLDEYVGLGASDAQSYATYMQNHLFQYKEFRDHFLPDGLAQNLTAEVLRYNQIVSDYPIDFQILGIGRNGHIGFNEPGSRFSELTRVVNLSPSTIAANARFFSSREQVPKQAISMGIASILAAKTIVLMAYGADKAEAVYQMVNGPVTEELPASSLQNHQDVYVIVDSEAGSRLTHHES